MTYLFIERHAQRYFYSPFLLEPNFLDTTLDKMEGTFRSFGRRAEKRSETTGVGVGEDSVDEDMGDRVDGRGRGGGHARYSPLGMRTSELHTSRLLSFISRT